MNKQRLRFMCMKISKETGLSFNSVHTHYFLEKILEKISNSKEKDKFIFKGGFLLSNVIGIEERSTIDMDFSIKQFSLTEEHIKEKFLEILKPVESDDIIYEIIKIEKIRQEDKYGGFCVSVLCKFENIRQIIPIDIATGDPITPHEIEYKYKSIFNNKVLNLYAYNIETVLAEKLQTIYHRGIFNSRSKDFYDIFILYKLKGNDIDFRTLKEACFNTFKYRKTDFNKENIFNLLDMLVEESKFHDRWKNYQKKFAYAQNLNFKDVIRSIKELVVKI